jgi:hypothetical protein
MLTYHRPVLSSLVWLWHTDTAINTTTTCVYVHTQTKVEGATRAQELVSVKRQAVADARSIAGGCAGVCTAYMILDRPWATFTYKCLLRMPVQPRTPCSHLVLILMPHLPCCCPCS